MASSSPRKACEFCKQSTFVLRNGWQLKDGTWSHLCDHCFSLYECGTFCEVFHEQQDGWRNCVLCEKNIHCGCIMSSHMFEINDDATGICCKACLSGEWPVDPSMGTPASSYDGTDGSPVQLVLALPAAGAASADEVLDFTSEEEDDPSLGTTAYSYDESPVRIVLALPADEGANANEDHDFFSDCTSEENYDPSWVCTPEEEYDPSWGTSASSYDGSPGVQIVQALRAAGAADLDEFPDCTSEEKDYEGNATPTPFASPEITENPSVGAEPLNLLSLIDENYFCPEVSNRPLQMNFGQKEVLMDTLDGKVVMERKKIDSCAPSK